MLSSVIKKYESFRFLFTLKLQAKPKSSLPVNSVNYREENILSTIAIVHTILLFIKSHSGRESTER
jgi:hypothetical protein